MKPKTSIILNSTILYVIAFLVTTIIHECAHALVGLLNHSEPVLHHNYVEHFSVDHLSVQQNVTIALAGPFISLLQGLVAGWAFLKSNRRRLVELFLLWFSVLGFNNFFGYLMTGPVFQAGDVGKAYALLGWPVVLQIIIAVLGALALLFIAYKITTPFLEFSYKLEWVGRARDRTGFSFRIIILAWLLGSAMVTMLYLPIIALVSIIYPVMSGMVFIFPWQNARRIDPVKLSDDYGIGKLSIGSIVVLIVLIAVFRLLLAPGIHL